MDDGNEQSLPHRDPLARPRLRLAPHVRWAVETRGLTLFRDEAGAWACIPYPYAAIWDLLQRGYNREATAGLVRYIANVSLETAREMTARAIDGWIQLGIVVPEDGHG